MKGKIVKKILLIISLITTMFIGLNCDRGPTEYDPKAKGWKFWVSGVVNKTNIKIERSRRTFIVEFVGDLKVEVLRFYNFNDIKVGQFGSIYKWPSGYDQYMWVPGDTNEQKTSTPISTLKTEPTPEQIIPPPAIPILKSTWEEANSTLPTPYQTVLIKFKNGIVTTAYCTQTKEWKAEIDKEKLSRGIPLKDVIQWKLVDLE
jgi:hypothetical protein